MRRNSFITKPSTVRAAAVAALLLFVCLPAFSAPAPAVAADPAGAALCSDKGEGTHTARHDTGAVKVRVVCRDGKGDAEVRYGWYFDDKGRQTREEDLVPGDKGKSRIIERVFELSADEPISSHVYDGTGKLLQATGGEKVKLARGDNPTFGDYLTYCQESPNALLYPLMGNEKEPQFFTKNACLCVAQKALRADEAPPGKVWKRTKTLNYANFKDRASVAALSHLGECLCPEAFPGSRLEQLCTHAPEIEKAWKK